MKADLNSFESIANSARNLNDLSRNIISYFATNNQFDSALLDDSSQESCIFNLAMQYLDDEKVSKREEIARKLENCIAEYHSRQKQ
jgi:hypothetical protein